jgi:peptidoglycan/LPS O-acetylase OafA/YrhL
LIQLFDYLVLSAFRHTAWSLVLTWLIWRAAMGFPGLLGRILGSRPATYLGKISYGVYVIHGFPAAIWIWFFYSAPIPGYRIFDRLGLPPNLMDSFAVNLAWHVIFTFTVAILSWKLFEAPINRLKRFFPYQKEPFEKSNHQPSI